MTISRAASAVWAFVAVAALTACSGDAGSTPMGASGMHHASGGLPSSATSRDQRHNAADVFFDHMMIPHHQSAVAMADLAADRARSDRVRALAARIRAAQGPEIVSMRARLTSWGLPSMPSTVSNSTMPMMGGGDVRSLESAAAADFDRRFLELMIPHHRDAVVMAETEIAEGVNPGTLALARSIRISQTAEISEMTRMLAALA